MKSYKLEVNSDELKKYSLFIATPCYGGQCYATYTKSLLGLSQMCQAYGIEMKTYFTSNESLVPRARNYIAEMFLQSGMTHMMCIDADIEFDPFSVISMLAIQISDPKKYDVLGGVYAKKSINWGKIKQYAPDVTDPMILADLTGNFVFNPLENNSTVRVDNPVEVAETGTGFMLIPRNVLTKYAETYTFLKYTPDHLQTEHFDGSKDITAFFHCDIDPVSKRYLSEDYYFCQKVREMGGHIWIIPWIPLKHTGSYSFDGSLIKEAKIVNDINQTKKVN